MNDVALGQPIPLGTIAELEHQAVSELSAPPPAGEADWIDAVTASWHLAMWPVTAWASVVTASWKMWEGYSSLPSPMTAPDRAANLI